MRLPLLQEQHVIELMKCHKHNKLFSIFVFVILLQLNLLSHANNYERIVSLDICSDWMLARYANREQVVALSPLLYQYPTETEHHDWPTHDGTLEHILEFKPDLVITGEFNATLLRSRLKELGINVKTTLLPTSIKELVFYVHDFLNLIGSNNDGIRLSNYNKVAAEAPRLLLLGANANATGTGTLENEILELAGWQNYIKSTGYGKVDLEKLVQDPPDAILWSSPTSPALANAFFEHAALKKVMRNKPTLVLDDGRWQCAGPWTLQQIEKLNMLREKWFQN